MAKAPITCFSFGYWGWGNATKELVQAVDAVERKRGFKPPVFVDVRLRRSVRAVGFRDNAFGELLGKNRYEHMSRLGNESIKTKAKRIKIKDPAAAEDLLDRIVEEAKNKRRVIFFCGCPWPMHGKKIGCHRTLVGTLLLEAAKRRRIRLEVVEWPGGEPEKVVMKVEPQVINTVVSSDPTRPIPIKNAREGIRYAGLPWYSLVSLKSDGETLHTLVRPACVQRSKWVLPVDGYSSPDYPDAVRYLTQHSKKLRRCWGLEPRRA